MCVGAGMEGNSAGLTEFDTPALIDLAEKPKQMNCGKKMVYIVDNTVNVAYFSRIWLTIHDSEDVLCNVCKQVLTESPRAGLHQTFEGLCLQVKKLRYKYCNYTTSE